MVAVLARVVTAVVQVAVVVQAAAVGLAAYRRIAAP